MDVKKIGDTIRYLRMREGYTQQEIADCLGISYQAVSKWERGICLPDATCLPQLAKYLNVELDDLLVGNVKYIDADWAGWLKIQNCDFLLSGKKSILDLSLCYFMLAGIRDIVIQCQIEQLEQIKIYTENYAERYGLNLTLCSDDVPPSFNGQHVMLISAPLFFYGTNLTKYFWMAMTRRNGISVLTVKGGDYYQRISVNKKGLVKRDEHGSACALPIYFIPNRFLDIYDQCDIYESKMLYAEPTARGLVHKLISSEKDVETVNEYIELVEDMTGEKIYDLDEVARERYLRNSDE